MRDWAALGAKIGSTLRNWPRAGSYSRAPMWVRLVPVSSGLPRNRLSSGHAVAAGPRADPNGVVYRLATDWVSSAETVSDVVPWASPATNDSLGVPDSFASAAILVPVMP